MSKKKNQTDVNEHEVEEDEDTPSLSRASWSYRAEDGSTTQLIPEPDEETSRMLLDVLAVFARYEQEALEMDEHDVRQPFHWLHEMQVLIKSLMWYCNFRAHGHGMY